MFRRLAWVRRSGVPCQADDCAANTRIFNLRERLQQFQRFSGIGVAVARVEVAAQFANRRRLLVPLPKVDNVRTWHRAAPTAVGPKTIIHAGLRVEQTPNGQMVTVGSIRLNK